VVNGNDVLRSFAGERRPRDVRSPARQPVLFLVRSEGVLPEWGRVECRSAVSGARQSLRLRRLAADELQSLLSAPARQSTPEEVERLVPEATKGKRRQRTDFESAGRSAIAEAWYAAEMPLLVEDFYYTLSLGDATTDPAAVRQIAPPLVEAEIEILPPDYVQLRPDVPPAPRQMTAIEGSRARVIVRSVNRKPLRAVSMTLTGGGRRSTHALVPGAADGLVWSLDGEPSPLDRISRDLQYEIQVRDIDAMELESPLRGLIRMQLDQPPDVALQTVHRVVLPSAKPLIEYQLYDDFGVARLLLHTDVERRPVGQGGGQVATSDEQNGGGGKSGVAPTREIPLDGQPLMVQNLPYRGSFPLDASALGLQKGDRIKVSLEVTDFRGATPGRSYRGEPLLLEISDEAGVLSAITEADQRAVEALGSIIEEQLRVGGEP
jgi:hypothetical protein